jgi:hypothetical protein
MLLLAAVLYGLPASIKSVVAQGTAFTYQGQLASDGSPANGSYDLEFTLFETNSNGTPVAGPITNAATGVSNGLFTVTLDFGAGIFSGRSYWLEVAVQTNGGSGFTTLSPRQPVTPVPYALFAPNAGAAMTAASANAVAPGATIPLSALPSAVVTNGSTNVSLNGTFAGNLTLLGSLNVNGPISGPLIIPSANSNAVYNSASFTNIEGEPNNEVTGVQCDPSGKLWYACYNSSTNGVVFEVRTNSINGAVVKSNYTAPLSLFNVAGGMSYYNGYLYICVGNGFDPGLSNYVVIFDTNANFIGSNWLGQEPRFVQQVQPLADGTALACYFGTYGATNLFFYNTTTWQTNGNVIQFQTPLTNYGAEDVTGFAIDSANYIHVLQNGIGGGLGYVPEPQWGWRPPYFVSTRVNSSGIGALELVGYPTFFPAGTGVIQGNPFFASNNFNILYVPYQGNTDVNTNFVSGYQLAGSTNQTQITSAGASIPYLAAGQFWDHGALTVGNNLIGPQAEFCVGSGGTTFDIYGTPEGASVFNVNPSTGQIIAGAGNWAWQFLFAGQYYGYSGFFTNGLGATPLDASQLTSGTVPLARLPGNVSYLNANQSFTGQNIFAGNVGIATASPSYLLQVSNAYCNGSSWVNAADRNLKQNFAPVDAQDMLDKVAALPVMRWNDKSQPDQTHVGPVAQDFRAAFDVGADDKHIATVDEEGVALAAIQGLNQKLKEKDVEIQELKERLDRLEKIIQQNPNLAAGAWSSRSPLVVTTNNGVISTTVPATDD